MAMEIVPTGKFEVKLEFEDDSFELIDAEIFADGTFLCESNKATIGKTFKMVFVDSADTYKEFQCSIKSKTELKVFGELSKLTFE
jgi:hypothetical protein